ncbi:hypothetical protein Dimus_001142, partial [Dionaea muscipula]
MVAIHDILRSMLGLLSCSPTHELVHGDLGRVPWTPELGPHEPCARPIAGFGCDDAGGSPSSPYGRAEFVDDSAWLQAVHCMRGGWPSPSSALVMSGYVPRSAAAMVGSSLSLV